MTDLGPNSKLYFLSISVTRTTSGIFLSQMKYATEILERAKMLNCNPCRTLVGTEKKLGPEGSPVTDPTLYCSLAREFCCSATRRSTSGYYVFLGDNLLTWSSKCQDTSSRSSAEAEYREAANAIAETSWICNLLRELHTPLFTATLVYCDNISAVYMSANPEVLIRAVKTDRGYHKTLEVDGYCNGGNLPGAYYIGNSLHYQDLEWYEALEDYELKDEALRNKAIME
ncbi:ribonuclease H-like domain-containing protein, partial [Tanacetum coccineum]